MSAVRRLAALPIAACLTAASLASCREPSASGPQGPPGPLGEVADVGREAAGDSVLALLRRGASAEALPYFRRIEQLELAPTPGFDAGLGATCNNAALESRVVRGVTMPAVRSTIERVALGREGLARLDRAVGRTSTAAESSAFLAIRAQALATWGFSREAVMTWRRADRCSRLTGRTRQQAALVEGWLLDPVPAPARRPRPRRRLSLRGARGRS